MALKDAEPTPSSRRCSEEFDLHELAVEDARHGHQRPKIEEYGDSLFAVLHTVEIGRPTSSTSARSTSSSAATTCSRCATAPSTASTDVRARCEREPELLSHGSGFVLYALMDAVVDRYFPVLDALEIELETIEERIFAGSLARAPTSRRSTRSSRS